MPEDIEKLRKKIQELSPVLGEPPADPADQWMDVFSARIVRHISITDAMTEKSHACIIENSHVGVEVIVPGFRHGVEEAQVFVEVYGGKLRIHIWDGTQEDPAHTIEIEPEENDEQSDS